MKDTSNTPRDEATKRARIAPSPEFAAFGRADIEQSIAARFEQQAARHARRTAVKSAVKAGKFEEYGYEALNRAANRIAHAVMARAPDQGPIALLLEHGAPFIATILGALKAGKTYVPLDASFPLERNRHILEDSGAGLVLASSGAIQAAAPLAAGRCAVMNIDQLPADLSEQNPDLDVAPDQPAYIIYTSGSTGRPKGVLQNHRNILNDVRQYTNALGIGPDDRMTLLYSCSVNGAVRGIFGALLNGASLYPFDVKAQGFAGLAELLMREEITIYHSVPTVFRHFVATLTGQEKFPGLRVIRLGGEQVLAQDVVLYQRHCPDDCVLYTGMGATETGHVREYFIDKQSRISGSVVPTGFAIEDKEVMLLDDARQAVGVGEIGEIAVKSEYLALGYWNKPELTRAAFQADPAGGKARLYLTGDLGKLRADGCLEHLGRKDFQVKVRGYRIELAEIERQLLGHPSLKEAVVVAQADRQGESQLVAYLVAYLVAACEPKPTMGELRDYLREKVPEYMLPAVFVLLDALPLTPNGKLDRLALPQPPSVFEQLRADAGGASLAPQTEDEKALANIWKAVLKLDSVGMHDDFLGLGGHSLLATQIVTRVRDSLGIAVPLHTLFAAPTIAGLAATVQALRASAPDTHAPPIVPVPRESALPLSYSQRRLWIFDQMQPGSPVYIVSRALRMRGRLDVAALHAALNAIVARHEVLRTTYTVSADGNPKQVIAAQLSVPLPLIDLRDLPVAASEAEVQRLTLENARRPFDLSRGPLLRASLLQLAEADHLFTLSYHHICGDNWSSVILFRELAEFYRAAREKKQAAPPALAVQYADFAYWQRHWLQGEVLEQQLSYWKRQLSGAPAILELPTDYPRPAVYSHAGAWQPFNVSRDLTHALKELGRGEGASLFMTLLAAYQVLLAQFSNRQDILVGAPIAGRNRAETENLIGVFINTLVLRADCSASVDFRELLRQVRATTLAAYAHQDLPFDLLVKELRPRRGPDHNVLVQVSFNWQNMPAPAPEMPGLTLRPLNAAMTETGEAEAGEAPNLRAFLFDNQTVRFDLVLFLWVQGDELHGRLEYNTDLFEAKTIQELIAHYGMLLEAAATNPDRRLADLPLLGTRHNRQSENMPDRPERTVPPKRHDQASRKNRFAAAKPKAVNAERLVKAAYLPPDAALPLIIEPELDDVDLIEWTKLHRGALDAELSKHGALLFRGFRVRSAAEFERFIRAISGELIEYSYRSTPRTKVEGSIYTSTEYPAAQSIPLHNEMSYSRNWPMKIWFLSVQQAIQGGETPIADSRKVFDRLDLKLRQRFSDRKVMYVRNYGSGLDLSWQDVFQTSDRAEVEAFCSRTSMTAEWMDEDRLRTRQVCQAVAEHPRTNERVWFNQAHLFHVSSLRPEARASLLAQFGETNLPRNAYYGDGSPIEDSILDEIRGVYAEVQVAFPWRESDILMLDNMLVAHGRKPFSGPRKVLVGMAEAFGMGEGGL